MEFDTVQPSVILAEKPISFNNNKPAPHNIHIYPRLFSRQISLSLAELKGYFLIRESLNSVGYVTDIPLCIEVKACGPAEVFYEGYQIISQVSHPDFNALPALMRSCW